MLDLKYLGYLDLDWLELAFTAIGYTSGWIPVGLSTVECVVDSCTVIRGPRSPPLPGENFDDYIEALLPVELENTHFLTSPTLDQWGSLGPLI